MSSTQTGTPRPSGADRGRFLTSGNLDELFAFRVVTLRQISETAPYMHDGALGTLADVIEFYDRGGGDEETIDRGRVDPLLTPLGLSDQEKDDLEAFLLALTDPTVEVRVPERVPSGLAPAGLEMQSAGSITTPGEVVFASARVLDPARLASFPNPFNAETTVTFELPGRA